MRSSKPRDGRRPRRWLLERLERRVVPAQFSVNVLVDAADATPLGDGIVDIDLQEPGNQVSLRGAIQESGALPGDDDVLVPDGEYLLDRPLFFDDFDDAVNVIGEGMNTIIDGNGNGQVIVVIGDSIEGLAATVRLESLVVRGGVAGVEEDGGGIFNAGSLTLDKVLVTENFAPNRGGGLANRGFANIIASTFFDNQAGDFEENSGRGGAIYHFSGTLTMVNSTVSGNLAAGPESSAGGGIVVDGGDVSLNFTTVTLNEASEAGGVLVETESQLSISHTIVANNSSPDCCPNSPDIDGAVESAGFNLIGNRGLALISAQPTDQIGGVGNPVIDPQLAPLTSDDQIPPHHVPVPFSPAVDRGSTAVNVTVDQRGRPRPVDANRGGIAQADIGSVEIDQLLIVGGRVVEDRLADGITVDDIGQVGRIVRLFLDNGDQEFDQGDEPIATATTNVDGQFDLGIRPAGDYWVVLTPDPTQRITVPADGTGVIGVTLTDADRIDVDFGVFTSPEIFGTVREDVDGDGVGDLPLGGVPVLIIADDGNGTLGAEDQVVETVVADSLGNYSASVDTGGRFFVNPIPPEGAVVLLGDRPTAHYTLDLVSGDVESEVDFEIAFLSSIQGTVFDDLMGDGITVDDAFLPGQTVRLFRDDGDGQFNPSEDGVAGETTTDNGGDYQFSDLVPGTYFVALDLPPDRIQTGGGTPPDDHYVLALTGGSELSADFAVFTQVPITGAVLEDLDGDGVGESPLAGVAVRLLRDDGNGQLGPEDTIVSTVASDASGEYTIIASTGGRHFVMAIPPVGAYIEPGQRPTLHYTLDLLSGQAQVDIDFAVVFFSTIQGTVFEDQTGDGITNDDPPLEGISVLLLLDDGDGQFDPNDDNEVGQATTDSSGEYGFDVLEPGTYFVVLDLPNTFIQTDGGTPPNSHYVLVVTSGSQLDADFGAAELGVISGQVWEDLDRDGQRDDNEPGLADWTVVLSNQSSGEELTTLTDSQGNYEFAGLLPGAYQVTTEQLPSHVASAPEPLYDQFAFLPTEPLAGSIVAGQLLEGSDPEMVVANEHEGSVWVVQATDENQLEPLAQIQLPEDVRPKGVVLADIDNDTDLDIVVVGAGRPELRSPLDPSRLDGSLWIIANLGGGDFVVREAIPVRGGPLDVVARDLNGDGRVDLAAIGFRTGELSVFHQTAGGSFLLAHHIGLGGTPVALEAVDLNGDGIADFVVGDDQRDVLQFLISNSAGLYQPVAELTGMPGPFDVVAAAVAGGQQTDLVIAQHDSDQLTVLLDVSVQAQQLVVGQRLNVPAGGRGATGVQVSDVNGDQVPDLVVAQSASAQLAVLYGLGQGTFSDPFAISGPWSAIGSLTGPRQVVTAELNDSGRLDFVAADITSGVVALFDQAPAYSVEVALADVETDNDFGMIPIDPDGTVLLAEPESDGDAGRQQELRLDVNNDGAVSPVDALMVINGLSATMAAAVAPGPQGGAGSGAEGENIGVASASRQASFDPRLDTSGDGNLSPLDALLVINHLNRLARQPASPAAPPSAAMALSAPGVVESMMVMDDCSETELPVARTSDWATTVGAAVDAAFADHGSGADPDQKFQLVKTRNSPSKLRSAPLPTGLT